ncbi:AbrB/MazE/SpoVT family DNA-binding domain-containing protein [Bifidobacterium aquikefiricola]|uniref:AbrB/MazE/SpoVT family DNA-binding domain-containing protein n=1 Tax=Bifidobacterium aquikefiricola TaxID=3059038 RepID=A0AB39U7D6_9BIFI
MTATKLVRWGNGQAVRLSKADIERIGVEPGDPLDVRVESDRIIIRPARHHSIEIPDYKRLFSGYDARQPREDGFARRAGEEH